MLNSHFNLVTDPWIRVIRSDSYENAEVSMQELFRNAQDYARLAGETKSQDLAVLRLLLAILQTVYSRFDATGKPYDWLEMDSQAMRPLAGPDMDDFDPDDLIQTWRDLRSRGRFTDEVEAYLTQYKSRFDFFGPTPFYQVTQEQYDSLVPAKKQTATGSGTVAIRQINRQVSESGNSPALFSPKTAGVKDSVGLGELIRWLITYQSYTGVTDKTKIITDDKFSNSAGWLYRIDPVYALGDTVFETLLLNLLLAPRPDAEYAIERPVWEWQSALDYVEDRKREVQPDNLAQLYTTWSRILYLQWDDDAKPVIFSAGIPGFSPNNVLIEPMTTWHWDKKEDANRPNTKNLRTLGRTMWRNFGEYVDLHRDDHSVQPGIVTWLQRLKDADAIDRDYQITLATAALVSDGNATSQAPAAEVAEDMAVRADVLFDKQGKENWPIRIEESIDTSEAVSKAYWQFITRIGTIRNTDSRSLAALESGRFYERLNEPFKSWLASLEPLENRDQKQIQWKRQLKRIVLAAAGEFMNSATPRDMQGITDSSGQNMNIFVAYRILSGTVNKILDLPKEEIS